VYFWENHNFIALFDKSRMPIRDARAMARKMASMFKCPPPKVVTWRGTSKGNTAEQLDWGIRVNTDKAHWTPIMLAHEVAHWVCDHKKVKGQDHGPVWMAVYMRIMDKFKILPLVVTVPFARAYGIKFKDPHRCF
jgi:hypothetical protein